MSLLWAWIKKYWWIVVLAIVAFAVTVWLIFRPKKNGEVPAVSFSTKAREEISKAETEATIEKLKITAKADEKRKELETIKNIKDDITRLKMLADFIDENL